MILITERSENLSYLYLGHLLSWQVLDYWCQIFIRIFSLSFNAIFFVISYLDKVFHHLRDFFIQTPMGFDISSQQAARIMPKFGTKVFKQKLKFFGTYPHLKNAYNDLDEQ